jgi:hypothetical protein
MTFKRVGLSYIDPEPRRAEQDREHNAAIQDLQGIEIEMVTAPTANTEFEIVHNLRNVVPRSIETMRTTKGGVVYASRFSEWNARRIFAKSTVAADQVLLRVR